MSLFSALYWGASLFALAASAGAEGVVNVGKSGSVGYPTLQTAIDAASDGDMLLVAKGTYPGFIIKDRSISIFAAPGAQVVIEGQVRVTKLAAHRSVVLAGLDVRPQEDPAGLMPITALELVDNAGHIRIEHCSGLGADYAGNYLPQVGGDGASVLHCDRVVFASSSMQGGQGCTYCAYPCTGGGGQGIRLVGSRAAVFGCALQGGYGGLDESCGGDGGSGMHCTTSLVWLAGSSATGGAGGGPIIFGLEQGGDGGHGVQIVTGVVHSLDNSLAGGAGGCGFLCQNNGANGLPFFQGGGTFVSWPGTARKIEAALVLHDERSNFASIQGEPGDRIWALGSARPGFNVVPFLSGWWLVPFPPRMTVSPLGSVSGSGSLFSTLPTEPVTHGFGGRVDFHQLFAIDAQGAAWLAEPFHQLLLNRDGPPDCDGNGVIDYCDALESPWLDLNGNLLIDACEI